MPGGVNCLYTGGSCLDSQSGESGTQTRVPESEGNP
jgi:hypothetical protein